MKDEKCNFMENIYYGYGGPVGAVLGRPGCLRSRQKPNILVIWGDDIGYWNLSHINHGIMGYKTPNIDRIASEGLHFTE